MPATFRQGLKNIAGLKVYGDDIVVNSKLVGKHTSRMTTVLERIKMAGSKLNFKKCQITRSKINCLDTLSEEEKSRC